MNSLVPLLNNAAWLDIPQIKAYDPVASDIPQIKAYDPVASVLL